MIDLTIYSLAQAKRHKRKFDAIITLESPELKHADMLRFHQNPQPAHLILKFEDLDQAFPNVTTATIQHAQTIIDFGRQHQDKKILVHCQAGVGRSGAAGLALIADYMGPGNEQEALQRLIAIRPEVCPNLMLTVAADEALKRNGALVDALLAENARRPDWQRLRQMKLDLYHKLPHIYS